jgi:hypothetical protein
MPSLNTENCTYQQELIPEKSKFSVLIHQNAKG